MSTSTAAVAAGTAAAAAAVRQEEEEMTNYSPQELAEGWEFKILRSNTSAFKRPEKLREILDQEAKAGWVLVEKFDNGRIRLKRPTSAQKDDRRLDFDPYRTHIGPSEGAFAAMIVGVLTLAALIAGLVGFMALR